jgi:hypothetical protein
MGQAIFTVVAFFFICAASCGMSELSCDSKASTMGFESNYGPVQGCMIKVKGAWIPVESYRTLQ